VQNLNTSGGDRYAMMEIDDVMDEKIKDLLDEEGQYNTSLIQESRTISRNISTGETRVLYISLMLHEIERSYGEISAHKELVVTRAEGVTEILKVSEKHHIRTHLTSPGKLKFIDMSTMRILTIPHDDSRVSDDLVRVTSFSIDARNRIVLPIDDRFVQIIQSD